VIILIKNFVNKFINSNFRSAKRDFITNGSRGNSIGNFYIKDARAVKDDYLTVEDNSIDVQDDETSEVNKAFKKRGRKRKTPVVDTEEQESEPEKSLTTTKIAKALVEDYGPNLNYKYQLWKKNSKVLDRASIGGEFAGNPIEWDIETVASFVRKIADEVTVAKFQEQEIDGIAFVALCQDDLVNLLDIKIGSAIKIYNRILYLREEIVQKFIKI
jgi:hypothetical protein